MEFSIHAIVRAARGSSIRQTLASVFYTNTMYGGLLYMGLGPSKSWALGHRTHCLPPRAGPVQGTLAFMRDKVGKAAADKFFGEGYYVVAMGANDFINNYLLPVYSDSWTYTGDTFVKYMVSTLEAQLKLLHALGARRLTFFGLGPMGCIPLQRYLTSSGGCQESTNKLARSFNTQAAALMDRLSASLPNATFQFGEAYDYFQDIIDRPYMYGFNNSRAPCCTLGRIRPTLTCTPLSTLCKDRSQYVFWDEYHPTDRANELIALETLRKLNITVVNNGTSG